MLRGIVRELVAAEVVYQAAKSWQALEGSPCLDGGDEGDYTGGSLIFPEF